MTQVLVRQASMLEAILSFFLVVGNYTKKDYVRFSFSVDWVTSLLKIGKQMFRRSNEVLVAKEDARVVGTISYMVDNGKLPIEAMFSEELSKLRATSAKLTYIGSFATVASKHCARTSILMIREVEKRSLLLGVTCAICVVNPAHVHFYTRYGFRVAKEAEVMEGLSEKASAVLLVKENLLQKTFNR